jgi:hypothetical protein
MATSCGETESANIICHEVSGGKVERRSPQGIGMLQLNAGLQAIFKVRRSLLWIGRAIAVSTGGSPDVVAM